MKITHIIKAQHVAGAEKHMMNLISLLNQTGHKPTLINIFENEDLAEKSYKSKIDQLREKKIKVFTLDKRDHNPLSLVNTIRELLKHLSPDIVHTHMAYADLLGSLAAKLNNHKIISTRHHDYGSSLKEIIKFAGYHSIANQLHDRTIAVSNNTKTLIETFEVGLNKVEVIHHGCKDDQKNKEKCREKILMELNIPTDATIFGTVGRLIALKGHEHVLQAIDKLSIENEKLYWLIIGDGPEMVNLQSSIEEKGLGEQTFLLGFRNDISTLMSAMDWLIHPTTAEAFGLVLIEAMRQSTPIIASNAGAIPEIVKDGETGFIFPSRNVEVLQKKMEHVINNPEIIQRMGANSRRIYEDKFTLDIMFQKTLSVYKDTIK